MTARRAVPRRIVLVAGPSGSGKGLMTRRSGLPLVPLDEFYRDLDDPTLPRRFGIVDWDHPASWDAGAALAALTALAHDGVAEIPEYSISSSRRTGMSTLDAREARLIVAEGIFAAQLVEPLRRAGLLADALVLARPAPLVFTLRLVRDLREHRKPPLTLIRRGLALAREQAEAVDAWAGAGMTRTRLHEGIDHLRSLARIAEAESAITCLPAGGRVGGGGSSAAHPDPVLEVAAVCFLRPGAGGPEVLCVRKRGTGSFMQPGGKLEPDESPRTCAVRELAEELGAVIDPEILEDLGTFEADAANEPATRMRAHVFCAPAEALDADVRVRAEIAEARWVPVTGPPLRIRLAPLLTEHILPILRERIAA